MPLAVLEIDELDEVLTERTNPSRVLDQLRRRLTDKAVLGGLLTAAISLVWVLQASPALISHGSNVQVVADQMTGSGWQI